MKRSHKLEKMAAVYDEEILPLWTQRFGRMVLRDLELPPKSMVLDVGCATGHVALEILRKTEDGRVIALDSHGPLLDVARRKAGDLSHRRIFFRTEQFKDRLSFADDVFNLAYSNARLHEFADPAVLVREFARITRPGGRVILTLPLRGTWDEFYDIYREVLTKHDKSDMLTKLEETIERLPTPDQAMGWLTDAGLQEADLEVEEFQLLFKSSREFFFAPVIEYGPLSTWKEIAGRGEDMQQVFWHIKEAIDTYFAGRAFQVTVKAACLRGVRAEVATEATPVLAGEELVVVEEAGAAQLGHSLSSSGIVAKRDKLISDEDDE
jgi:ubiquinone/menaquinone biosynthesis C-methylase UbiE